MQNKIIRIFDSSRFVQLNDTQRLGKLLTQQQCVLSTHPEQLLIVVNVG